MEKDLRIEKREREAKAGEKEERKYMDEGQILK